jgi:hypothetical protein
MRPGVIVVVHVLSEHAAKMAFVEDQEMIKAFPADTLQEVLTDGSGPRSGVRSAEDLNPAGRRDASNLSAVLAVMDTAQRAWSNPNGCRLTTDRDPRSMRRKANRERNQRSVTTEEVAGPDLVRVVAEKGRPGLAMSLRWSSWLHRRLDRAVPHVDAQLESLAKGSAPHSRFSAAIVMITVLVSSGRRGVVDRVTDLAFQKS